MIYLKYFTKNYKLIKNKYSTYTTGKDIKMTTSWIGKFMFLSLYFILLTFVQWIEIIYNF